MDESVMITSNYKKDLLHVKIQKATRISYSKAESMNKVQKKK